MTLDHEYASTIATLTALPQQLRDRRASAALSLRAAAQIIGVSTSTLHRIETGRGANLRSVIAVLRWLADTEGGARP